jgi:hypothetical protein
VILDLQAQGGDLFGDATRSLDEAKPVVAGARKTRGLGKLLNRPEEVTRERVKA